jgi:Holliday junction resolvase RusA-like endonuclease
VTSSGAGSHTKALLAVTVVGVPAPQGSKSFKGLRGGKPVLVESCAAVAPWRKAVVEAARAGMTKASWTTLTGPAVVTIDFFLVRAASTPKRRVLPDRRPDLDKLIRAVLDGLTTAGVYEDDARVVKVVASKQYAGEWTGARITISPR